VNVCIKLIIATFVFGSLNTVEVAAQDVLPASFSDEIQGSHAEKPLVGERSPNIRPGMAASSETPDSTARHDEYSIDSKYYADDFDFDIGYDNGLLLQVIEEDQSFSLKTNLRNQFRTGTFTRDRSTWTDNAGIVRPIINRQDFDIERARLVFSGHAFTDQLKYFLQLDGDTDRGHFVTFFDYWWAWKFSDKREVRFGKRKNPGSRNWILGAFDTRLADRPFSTDFFRPGRTVGVWLVGRPSDTTYYELMVGAGFRTDNLTPLDTSDEFAFGGTFWWDAWGDYGRLSPVDFEFHDDPAVRLGYSWTAANQGKRGQVLPESDFLRLSDGTRLTQTGALAPGATVEQFHVFLLSLDAAFKHRGWSMNSEYFLRLVEDIDADMPIPRSELFQHGFYVEGGYFVLPRKLELNAQVARVSGEFGSTSSVAAGFSWYPRETRNMKFTLDATMIDGSPVNSTGSDILLGDDGVLVRAQMQAQF